MNTDEAYAIVNRLLDGLPADSYLVLCDPTADIDSEAMIEHMRLWNQSGGTPPLTLRSHQELARFFDRLELVEPGVVSPMLWRPDHIELGTLAEVAQFCGVGRKPR